MEKRKKEREMERGLDESERVRGGARVREGARVRVREEAKAREGESEQEGERGKGEGDGRMIVPLAELAKAGAKRQPRGKKAHHGADSYARYATGPGNF